MNAIYPHSNSIIDDVFDLDVMKFVVSTQLFNDGRLACSWRSSYQYTEWLHSSDNIAYWCGTARHCKSVKTIIIFIISTFNAEEKTPPTSAKKPLQGSTVDSKQVLYQTKSCLVRCYSNTDQSLLLSIRHYRHGCTWFYDIRHCSIKHRKGHLEVTCWNSAFW